MNNKQIGLIVWALWTLACLLIILISPQIDWELIGIMILTITLLVGVVMLFVLAFLGFCCWMVGEAED